MCLLFGKCRWRVESLRFDLVKPFETDPNGNIRPSILDLRMSLVRELFLISFLPFPILFVQLSYVRGDQIPWIAEWARGRVYEVERNFVRFMEIL
jgi:hypothetical protein